MVVPGSTPSMIFSLFKSFVLLQDNQPQCVPRVSASTCMSSLSHKTKQFLHRSLKLFIVLAALTFIGMKLAGDDQLSFPVLWESLRSNQVFSVEHVGFLLLLTLLNWIFEVRKWQVLSSSVRKNSLTASTRESLASFTAAIFTPSRIGEYGAKALYYSKGNRKRILFLNFLGNSLQLLMSLVFGIIGLVYFLYHMPLPLKWYHLMWMIISLIAPIIVYRFLRKKTFKIYGYSLQNLRNALQKVPRKVKYQVLLYAGLRYFIFTHQFYYFLLIFGIAVPYPLLIAAVASMYFLSSILPTLMIFDALIKGGFGVWIFSFLGIDQMVVLVVVLAVWLLNFGLPALIGSYFVLKFKPPKKLPA